MRSERPSLNCEFSSACFNCSEPRLSPHQRRKSLRGVEELLSPPETLLQKSKWLKSSQRQARSRLSRPQAETGRRRPYEPLRATESSSSDRPVHLTVILRVGATTLCCTCCKDAPSPHRPSHPRLLHSGSGYIGRQRRQTHTLRTNRGQTNFPDGVSFLED